jgi:signal transduction histidine kinase
MYSLSPFIISAILLFSDCDAQLTDLGRSSGLENAEFRQNTASEMAVPEIGTTEFMSHLKSQETHQQMNAGNQFLMDDAKASIGLRSEQSVAGDTFLEIMALVKDASVMLHGRGEEVFKDFRIAGSRWRQSETYIFVLDPNGTMLVHPDPELEGKNQLGLKDINGKPIVRGLISAVTTFPNKKEGWYHYEWPVPGGLLPRWKSSYVRLVTLPSGRSFIVGCGIYTDRMEREFVVDAVKDAVEQIEKNKKVAFKLFYDPSGPFIVKDAYIFVIDQQGIDLVNPGFPNLEGRNILNLKDKKGKLLVNEMFNILRTSNSGWVDYMWPKPGESISTQKSAYISKAKYGDSWVIVGCGVYLEDAPKEISTSNKMTATELMSLVRESASVFEQGGEKMFPEFRKKETKWFRDDTYFFVWTLDGVRTFHAADSSIEGLNVRKLKDVHGRPIGRMIIDAAYSPKGEGWVHYMYPEPGDIFPMWKSTFVKRVTFPSGKQYIVGCGIYNMQIDQAFIEDVVNRAATLVEKQGKEAFAKLRDKTGPFIFMDTYVFVDNMDGIELVNPAQPSLEGKNLIDQKDIKGKTVVREYIDAAVKKGTAWVDYYWYKPGGDEPAHKWSYVRMVQSGKEIFIVGSGYYLSEQIE